MKRLISSSHLLVVILLSLQAGLLAATAGPPAPALISPAAGAAGVSVNPLLSWSASTGAISYDIYIGTTNQPKAIANTISLTYTPPTLNGGTTYFWKVVAKDGAGGSTSSPTSSFTTLMSGPAAATLLSPTNGATGVLLNTSITWNAAPGATSYDVYFGTTNPPPFTINTQSVSYTPPQLSAGLTYFWSIVAKNDSGSTPSTIFSFTTATTNGAGLRFVPITPCRVIDTRAGEGTTGLFGPPTMAAGSTRTIPIPQGRCSIPFTAAAYSLNVTVVPSGVLTYLTMWPAGQSQPLVSTLNAPNGGIVANAALVPAGTNGGISVFVTEQTDVIVDINGYFDSPLSAFSFYTTTPCRVADTRNTAGTFGGPALSAGQTRDFPVLASACGIPPAQAYSTNITVVPKGPLAYLTMWPSGEPEPLVSTLNSPAGNIVANASLVSSGSSGGVSVFATNPTDMVLDINGYFAAAGSPGALSFYPVSPCRVLDTRNAAGSFGGPVMAAGSSRSVPVPASPCNIPATAKAYSINVTVVPLEPLAFLTVWPTGQPQPVVSTLNSDGRIVANAAIVPAGTGGAITVFVTNQSHVVLDINGYFAP